nr:hypothetical protein CFP56_63967 [Quercus suber]
MLSIARCPIMISESQGAGRGRLAGGIQLGTLSFTVATTEAGLVFEGLESTVNTGEDGTATRLDLISPPFHFPYKLLKTPRMPPHTSTKNRWTESQRRVVISLFRRPNLTLTQRLQLFNRIFSDELAQCGLQKGIKVTTLYAQWREMIRQAANWQHLLGGPQSEEQVRSIRKWDERIEAEARVCRIEVFAVVDSGAKSPQAGELTAKAARKRTRAVDQEVGERTASPVTKQRKTQGPVATVRIPTSGEDVMPTTPSKQRPGATILFTQPTGSSHWITPAEYAGTVAPIGIIPEEVLHPPLQGLLFRWWNEDSNGINQANGFVAGSFKYNNIPPEAPPTQENMRWTDFESHIGSEFLSHARLSNALSEEGRFDTLSRASWKMHALHLHKQPSLKNSENRGTGAVEGEGERPASRSGLHHRH